MNSKSKIGQEATLCMANKMNIAILLAGGTGTRLGADRPKQFVPIGNTEMFIHSLKTFSNHPMIDQIILVCEKEHIELAKNITATNMLSCHTIEGGTSRQKSVYNGICFAKDNFGLDNIVIIHDTARPFVSEEIITLNLKEAAEFGACTTVIPAQDTILVSHDHKNVDDIPKRDNLFLVQTPQTFRLNTILNAHLNAVNEENTDDAGIITSQGGLVKLVLGNKRNFKVTTAEDLILANAIATLLNDV